jgi:hypothetical protein
MIFERLARWVILFYLNVRPKHLARQFFAALKKEFAAA